MFRKTVIALAALVYFSGGALAQTSVHDDSVGRPGDSAWVSGNGTVISLLKGLVSGVNAAIAAGTNYIGQFGMVPVVSGGLSMYVLEPGASDNHASIKTSAGQVYHISVFSKTATVQYMRLYDAGSGFNGCGSATNLKWEMIIRGDAAGAATIQEITQGLAFSNGIAICFTGGYGQTDTTNATASNLVVSIGYK